jgi:hypothetical protein
MDQDLHKELEKLVIKYKGCLIYITPEGFRTGNTPFPTLREAKKKIDNTFLTWSNSIKTNNNNGNIRH